MPLENRMNCFCPGTMRSALANVVIPRRNFWAICLDSQRLIFVSPDFLTAIALVAPLRIFPGPEPLGGLLPVLFLDLVGPTHDFFLPHRFDRLLNLRVVGGQVFVDDKTLEHRIGNERDLVARGHVGVQKMESGLPGLGDPPGVVVGEIEIEEELAVLVAAERQSRLDLLGGRRRRSRRLCRRGGRRSPEHAPFEIRHRHGLAVVRDR